MRKLFLHILLPAIAIIGFSSCQKQEEKTNYPSARDTTAIIEWYKQQTRTTKGKASSRTEPNPVLTSRDWVSYYHQSDLYNNLVTDSYLIDVDTLKKYYPATMRLRYYHIFIAFRRKDDPSSMTLVLTGVDDKGKHVFLPAGETDVRKQFILEHCLPCPPCSKALHADGTPMPVNPDLN